MEFLAKCDSRHGRLLGGQNEARKPLKIGVGQPKISNVRRVVLPIKHLST